MGENPPPTRDIEGVMNACQRGAELTRSLFGFVKDKPEAVERFSLNNQVREIELLLSNLTEKSIIIAITLEKQPTFVRGNASKINHAFMNICLNSVKAMQQGGELSLTTKRIEVTDEASGDCGDIDPGIYVCTRITDTGVGMDPETIERAFEPFFTTAPNDGGTGLGLAMVAKTVQEHDGKVIIESERGMGTAVTLYLPADPTKVSIPAEMEKSNIRETDPHPNYTFSAKESPLIS